MSRPILRIPLFVLGPRVFTYAEAADQKPWSLVNQQIEPLWADTKGRGITVAVIDTGLWKHKDLPDPAFAVNYSRSGSVYDANGHGTHVAGTIGARLDGVGVVGYAPECNIGCVKALGDDGSGTSLAIERGIHYAAEMGADIINMSLGGAFDQGIANACLEVIQQGIFVICAAGNEGTHGVGYPGALKETLAIASYNKDGKISSFSSRGPEVDVAFPGEDILSTWPNDAFRRISGTSMATPAACGLTALMLAYHRDHPQVSPIKTNNQLRAHWQAHAKDAGDPGKDNAFGWGIPDAAGVVRGNPAGPADPDKPDEPEKPEKPGDGGDCSLVPLFNFGGVHVARAHLQGESGLFFFID